uniref:FZ domain-containing protein n=1 Tax=Mesocestoides corti TaxID=53468 RepID=A0A5K3G0H5_MESCO
MLDSEEEQEQLAFTSNAEAELVEQNEEEVNEETVQEQQFSRHSSSNLTTDYTSRITETQTYRTLLYYTMLALSGQALLSLPICVAQTDLADSNPESFPDYVYPALTQAEICPEEIIRLLFQLP